VLALEFCILTAAQSGEVLGARSSEIDLKNGIWMVPANRMKASREHRVPLRHLRHCVLRRTMLGRALLSGDQRFFLAKRDSTLTLRKSSSARASVL
jgi:integrase